jgi:hypothetical protein
MSDIWGVGPVNYGMAAPTPIVPWGSQQSRQQQQQQRRQSGEPLDISPQGPGGPSWLDRLRAYLSPATPTGPAPGSPDDYALRYPNPNPPVSTDVGEGPTPMSYEAPPLSLAPTVPAPGMLPYGYGSPSGYDPALFGPPTYTSRQGGGPAAPAGHVTLVPVDYNPFQ